MTIVEDTKTTGRRRFVLFLVTGGIAAAVNIICRLLLNSVMSYEAAIPVAYLIGMGVAYVLNRALVFAPSGRAISDEWVRFSIVNLIAAGQVWIVSVGLARVVFPAIGFGFHTETTAHVIGVLSPVFTSYIGHKHITFRPKRGSAG